MSSINLLWRKRLECLFMAFKSRLNAVWRFLNFFIARQRAFWELIVFWKVDFPFVFFRLVEGVLVLFRKFKIIFELCGVFWRRRKLFFDLHIFFVGARKPHFVNFFANFSSLRQVILYFLSLLWFLKLSLWPLSINQFVPFLNCFWLNLKIYLFSVFPHSK